MHIIIGVLGSVVTILWLLHRLAEMGIDLGGLNPWLWQRRRRWQQRHDSNPVFAIDHPMDATALVLTAIAKADGAMSSDEKQHLLETFQREFGLSGRDAAGLLISSNHLLGRGEEVRSNLNGVLQPSLDSFSVEQLHSAVALIEEIAEVDGPATEMQRDLVSQAKSILEQRLAPKGKWD